MNLRPPGYEPDELPTALPRDGKMVEREGFEPSKAEPTDLQSAPFSHSGTSPFMIKDTRYKIQETGDKIKSYSGFRNLAS